MKDIIGMAVEYNNNLNTVMGNGVVKGYPIGGMLCDYLRFTPAALKDLLTSMPLSTEPDTIENRDQALNWLYERVLGQYGIVAALMMVVDLSSFLFDISPNDPEKSRIAIAMSESFFSDELKAATFSGTPYSTFGTENIGQSFLTAFAPYLQQYSLIYTTVHDYIDSNYETERIATFFEDNTQFQDIHYRIMLYDGSFHSVYGIKSGMGLALFELAHLSQEKRTIKHCKNCGRLFVPFGRADTLYCGYPTEENPATTCRNVASRSVKARMHKNDLVTQEYRRLYMRYKMALKRHPDNTQLVDRFAELKGEMASKRKLREAAILSSDEILEWLATMDIDTHE